MIGFVLALLLADPCAAAARRTLADANVDVREVADESVVRDLCHGLHRLPAPLRRVPGETLSFRWHPTPHPHGFDDRADMLVLHPYARSGDEHAEWRLEGLDDAIRTRLWRARAMVHAVVRRHAVRRRWADSPTWHRATGWAGPFERPFTFFERPGSTAPEAFSRARGADSALLDLVTFAEEWLVPAEAFGAALPPDDRLACQAFGKSRALRSLLAADDPSIAAQLPADATCPAFEAWADLARLSHVEVLAVSASGRSPESMFGHLLVQLVPRDEPDERGVRRSEGFRTAVQLVALTGYGRRDLSYVWNGLTGGFHLVTLTTTLGDVVGEAARLEQRTMRRFRLALTDDERRRFVETVWDRERRGYAPYRFFVSNCASALLDLVDAAIDAPPLARPGTLWLAPMQALDTLLRTTRPGPHGSPQPLLAPTPHAYRSSLEAALLAGEERAATIDDLAELLAPEALTELRRIDARVTSGEPGDRIAAHAEMASFLERHAHDANAGPPLRRWLASLVTLERAATDVAFAERVEIESALVQPADDLPTANGTAERRRAFLRESDLQQRIAFVGREAALIDALRTSPRREPTTDEARRIAHAEEARAAFVSLTEVQATTFESAWTDVDASAERRSLESARNAAEADAQAVSLTTSGASRMTVRAGVRFGAGAVPTVSLRTAALAEDLGEQRIAGGQPGTSVRILDGELELQPQTDAWPAVRSTFVPFAFRSLVRKPAAMRTSLLDHLGWGISTEHDSAPDRLRRHRWRASAEALWIPFATPRAEAFVAVGLGVEAAAATGADLVAPAGPRVSLAWRVPFGRSASGLRLDASAVPGVDLLTGGFAPSATLAVRADLAFPNRVGRELVLAPALEAEWSRDVVARGTWATARAVLGIEWR